MQSANKRQRAAALSIFAAASTAASGRDLDGISTGLRWGPGLGQDFPKGKAEKGGRNKKKGEAT